MKQTKLNWTTLELAQRQAMLARANDRRVAAQLLQLVRAPEEYGVYASIGPNYHYSIFGRDSIEFAEDILAFFPDLSFEVICTMARLQGRQHNQRTEEEPGKMHHEYRRLQFDGDIISPSARTVFNALQKRWAQPEDDYILYYGSIDATPLFIRLVGFYVQLFGPQLLDVRVRHISNEVVTIRQAVEYAMEWLMTKLESSAWGLLEFQRTNPQGLKNQAWKDSETAYLHLDGSQAAADNGLASIEVQGFAYDALLAGRGLLRYSPRQEQRIMELATALARSTIEYMWMPGENFFAMGLDRGPDGKPRQIATLTSNAGLLLQSDLLIVVGQRRALEYIEPMVHAFMSSKHFLTPAGVRCRSLAHAGLIDFADYHGSLVTWPKDTANVAEGLRRWGYVQEAIELERYLVHSIIEAGEAYEFFYVNADNLTKLHYRIEFSDEPTFHAFGAANLPEPMQAWSLSSFLKIKLRGFAKRGRPVHT